MKNLYFFKTWTAFIYLCCAGQNIQAAATISDENLLDQEHYEKLIKVEETLIIKIMASQSAMQNELEIAFTKAIAPSALDKLINRNMQESQDLENRRLASQKKIADYTAIIRSIKGRLPKKALSIDTSACKLRPKKRKLKEQIKNFKDHVANLEVMLNSYEMDFRLNKIDQETLQQKKLNLVKQISTFSAKIEENKKAMALLDPTKKDEDSDEEENSEDSDAVSPKVQSYIDRQERPIKLLNKLISQAKSMIKPGPNAIHLGFNDEVIFKSLETIKKYESEILEHFTYFIRGLENAKMVATAKINTVQTIEKLLQDYYDEALIKLTNMYLDSTQYINITCGQLFKPTAAFDRVVSKLLPEFKNQSQPAAKKSIAKSESKAPVK